MAPWLGCDQTERLLVPALEQLSAHPEFGVRKVCASLYGDFCAVISTTKTESVLVSSQKIYFSIEVKTFLGNHINLQVFRGFHNNFPPSSYCDL